MDNKEFFDECKRFVSEGWWMSEPEVQEMEDRYIEDRDNFIKKLNNINKMWGLLNGL